ncbi:MAG: response regulator [Planctomycetes bacterium]|nr:response regulator [Planctomycetota bacterium]
MPPITMQPAHEHALIPQRTKDGPRRQRGSRVLLVEDEPLTAEVFARALSRDGHEVEVARDGLQALRRLHDRAPTLVVLDMSLPTVSGADVVRRLRADGHIDLPVVVVSGSSRAQAGLTSTELWPGLWVEKPVKPRDLVQVVREFLRESD